MTGRAEALRAEAYELLEMNPAQVEEVPQISHLIRSLGGTEKVMEYLAGSEHKEARAVVSLYRGMTVNRARLLPIEAFCIKAGVTTKRMIGLIQEEIFEQERISALLLAKSSRTRVVQATVDSAMGPKGSKDREMLHKHDEFLPIPKSTFIPIKGNVNIDASQKQVNMVLPPMEDSVKRLSDRFNILNVEVQKALPEPEFVDNDPEDDNETE